MYEVHGSVFSHIHSSQVQFEGYKMHMADVRAVTWLLGAASHLALVYQLTK